MICDGLMHAVGFFFIFFAIFIRVCAQSIYGVWRKNVVSRTQAHMCQYHRWEFQVGRKITFVVKCKFRIGIFAWMENNSNTWYTLKRERVWDFSQFRFFRRGAVLFLYGFCTARHGERAQCTPLASFLPVYIDVTLIRNDCDATICLRGCKGMFWCTHLIRVVYFNVRANG